jgi:hypothetical protein
MSRFTKNRIIYKRLREKKTLSKIRQGESLRKLEVRIGLGLKKLTRVISFNYQYLGG